MNTDLQDQGQGSKQKAPPGEALAGGAADWNNGVRLAVGPRGKTGVFVEWIGQKSKRLSVFLFNYLGNRNNPKIPQPSQHRPFLDPEIHRSQITSFQTDQYSQI